MKITSDEDDDKEAVEATTVSGWFLNYIVVFTIVKQTLFALWKGYYYFLGIIWYGIVLKVIGVVALLHSTSIYKAIYQKYHIVKSTSVSQKFEQAKALVIFFF